MKLIDKDALVAKIEKIIELFTSEKNQEGASQIDKLSLGGRIAELQELKVLLNTLEVKEVDLESEIENVRKSHFINSDFDKAILDGRNITNIAKHFFELGLKA